MTCLSMLKLKSVTAACMLIGQRPAPNNVMPARHFMLSSGIAGLTRFSVGLPERVSAYAVQVRSAAPPVR
jgi:hypothetical protein